MIAPPFVAPVLAAGFGPGEVMAVILGAGIAATIIWLGIARSRERAYTTTPTLPAPRLGTHEPSDRQAG